MSALQDEACNRALIQIELLLREAERTLSDFGIPAPDVPPSPVPRVLEKELNYNPDEQEAIVQASISFP